MKNSYTKNNLVCKLCLLLLLSFSFSFSKVSASIGDTLVVVAHNNVHMNQHGDYDAWAVLPSDTFHFSKILMKYTLGCASTGCAAYDYTTQVFARIASGKFDSTLTQYPSFKVNGVMVDSVKFNSQPVYHYFFNSITMSKDSTVAVSFQLKLFQDTVHPGVATDSMQVYPGNFYNPIFNTAGVIVDSVYVSYTSFLHVTYTSACAYTRHLDLIEMGRVMTPYGGSLGASWKNDYTFDVTDYKPMLHDSVPMRIFFDGWADGYRVSVTFYMIQGTPPRDAKRVRVMYPDSYYEYGITTNPIESHLVALKFAIDSNETNALLRVTPSGHSFGGAQNCAEFCDKRYYVFVNGTSRYQQHVWRSDCGMNPISAQIGTWIYDRSNWCPGSKTITKEHELTPYITPGDSVLLNLNFDTYTYSGGAGFNPGYILSANLITFGNPNFSVDATVDEIISPNKELTYGRFNPICNNPQIVIRNTGKDTLKNCTISYGIKGGAVQTYNWTGSLPFLARTNVQLGNMVWGSATGTPNLFEARISNPNGVVDQNIYNDAMQSTVGFTPEYPAQFILSLKTNTAPGETSWQLKNDQGVVLYQNGTLAASTTYKDTFNLVAGCYELKINDSGKNGLSFPAGGNPNGTGLLRLINANGTTLKTINTNFGTQTTERFTVGFTTGIKEPKANEVLLQLYPNPAQDKVVVNMILPTQSDVELLFISLDGRVLLQKNYANVYQQSMEVDVNALPAGMYFVTLKTNHQLVARKLLKL